MGRRQRRRAVQNGGTAVPPAATARYTPPVNLTIRVRPVWHKAIGALSIVFGVAIVIVNFIDYDSVRILPGGHQEGYFLLGILVAATALWWFGALDRDPDPEDIRREMARQRAARGDAPTKGRRGNVVR